MAQLQSTSITGSLIVTQGITGSFSGSITNAVSASYAATASYALNAGDSIWTGSAGDIYYSGGNVGIGTSSPYALLTVGGTTNSGLYSTDAIVVSGSRAITIGNNVRAIWGLDATTPTSTTFQSKLNIWSLNSDHITFGGSTTFLRTAWEDFKLWINNDSPAEGILHLYHTDAQVEFTRLAGSGNSWIGGNAVGIGTTSPSEKLHVIGNTILQATSTGNGTTAIRVNNSAGTQVLAIGAAGEIIMNNSSKISTIVDPTSTQPQLELYNGATGYTTLQSSTSYGLLLNPSGGNIGIGTVSPGAKLEVAGNIFQSSGILYTDHVTPYSGNQLQLLGGGSNYLYINGNVGIGTTSPKAKFQINNGHIAVYHNVSTDGAQIYLGDTNFDNSGYWNSAPGIGSVFSPGTVVAGDLAFYVYTGVSNSRTERMRIINSGNVGIGTSSPAAKLDVFGLTNTSIFNIRQSAGILSQIESDNGYANLFLYQAGGNPKIGLVSNGSSYFNGGNVGIGTTNPTAKLQIANPDAGADGFQFQRWVYTAGTAGVYELHLKQTVTSGVVRYNFSMINGSTAYNDVLVLDRGKVGIGTTDPARKLNIVDGGGPQLRLSDGTANTFWEFYSVFYQSNQDLIIQNQNGSAITINSGGNVGIGATIPSQKLHVVGNQYITGTITVGASGNYSNVNFVRADGAGVGGIGWRSDGTFYVGGHPDYGPTAGNRVRVYGFGELLSLGNTQAGDVVNINTSGNVGIGTTSPGAILDVNGALSNGRSIIRVTNSDTANYITVGAGIPGISNAGMNFTLDGTSRMVISAGGNVGIGTASSFTTGGTAKLSILGSSVMLTMGASTSDLMYFRQIATGEYQIQTNNGGNDGNIQLQPYGGNVGIGTTNPKQRLIVEGVLATKPSSVDGYYSYLKSNWNENDAFELGISENGYSGTFHKLITSSNYYFGSTLQFWTADTERIRINAAGNVGIGTTSPSEKLDVQGNVYVNGDIRSQGIFRDYQGEALLQTTTGAITQLGSNGAGTPRTLAFLAGNAERMRITSGGNVGIGTTSPQRRLQITDGEVYVRLNPTTVAGTYLVGAADGKFYIIPESTFVPTVTLSAGNVGIGTVSPAYKLDVSGTGRFSGDINLGSSGEHYLQNDASTTFVGLNFDSPYIRFGVNNTERMRITSGGNVGIGTPNPSSKLHVEGNISAGVEYNGGFYANANSSTVDVNWGFDFSKSPSISDYSTRVKFYSSTGSSIKLGFWDSRTSSYVGYFDGGLAVPNFIIPNGNIGIGTTSPTGLLHIYGTDAAFRIQNNGTGNMQFGQWDTVNNRIQSSGRDFLLTQTDSFNMLFHTNSTERMRITSGGEVGIGVTPSSGNRFWVRGSDSTAGNTSLVTQNSSGTITMLVRNDGYVGIGTSSPANKLVVTSDASPTNENTYAIAAASASDPAYKTIIGYDYTNDIGLIAAVRTGIGWRNLSIPQGNVGIGTTSPSVKLDVAGNIKSSNVIYWNGTAGALSWDTGLVTIETNTATAIALKTNSVERMRITSGGNVGIGLTTPQKVLDVFGSAGILGSFGASLGIGQFAGIHFGYSESHLNNDSYKKSALVFERTDNNNQGGNASGKIHFLLNNSGNNSATTLSAAVVTIDSDANGTVGSVRMGVGTRNPTATLNVSGSTNVLNVRGSGSAATSSIFSVDGNNGRLFEVSDDLSNSLFSVNTIAGLPVIEAFADYTVTMGTYGAYTLQVTGSRVGVGTSSPGYPLHVSGSVSGISIYATNDIAAFSDQSVKTDLQVIDSAVDRIKQINGYTYVRVDDLSNTRRAGVIAQEVQKVLPEVVSENTDGTLNVAYSNMIALLIEGMKEQQSQIDELKQRLDNL